MKATEEIKVSLNHIMQAVELYTNVEDIRAVVARAAQDIETELERIDTNV